MFKSKLISDLLCDSALEIGFISQKAALEIRRSTRAWRWRYWRGFGIPYTLDGITITATRHKKTKGGL